jgi:hypothetical protein
LGKPILSVKYGNFSESTVMEFLSGNYQHGFQIENPDQYRIETVAKQFLALLNPEQ